ncbi:MAG: hypothetical protein WC671_02990 [Candidatus Paceibacterota bacterium]|jgi:hypothetical protein
MKDRPEILEEHYPDYLVRWASSALEKAGFTPGDMLLLGQPEQRQKIAEFRLVLHDRAEIVLSPLPVVEKTEGEHKKPQIYSGA